MAKKVTAKNPVAPSEDESEPEVSEGRQESEEEDEKPQVATVPTEHDKAKRMTSFRTRTISTVALISMLLVILWTGHIPASLLVVALQTFVVKECFAIASVDLQDRKLPGFRLQQWYFFLVAESFLYLRFIKRNLIFELTSTRFLPMLFKTLLKRHTLISFCMYMAGFVSFVLSLKRGLYLYQFGQYAWTHMIIIVTIIPSSFFVSNIFEGLIWFVLPSVLVVVNDICAYLFGFFFGRTPLIKLSPKKTWEGFIGGFFSTMVAAFVISWIIAQSKWLTCPRKDLAMGPLDCERDELYITREYTLEELANLALPDAFLPLGDQALTYLFPASHTWYRNLNFYCMPVQLHAIVLGAFASVIAPFGGFFASGIKRAFKKKDFGNTIPGHGGITDRFDCMIIIGMFSYLYYWSCIATPVIQVGEVLALALKLDDHSQMQLFLHLGNLLAGQGLIPESVIDGLANSSI